MRTKIHTWMLVALVALLVVCDTASAQLFRRGRRNYRYSYNSGGGYVARTAQALASAAKPFVGLLRRRSNRNRSEYDYNWAARRDWYNDQAQPVLFADKVRIKLLLKDETAGVFDDLRVHVSWVYLHKSKTWHKDWVDLQRDGDDVFIDVTGLEEGRVVKVVTDFYQKIEPQSSGGSSMKTASMKTDKNASEDSTRFKYLGRMHTPYYGVTTSVDNEELKRRAQIVSFGFSQWYVDEAYGGRRCPYDCHSFFKSSTAGELHGFTLKPVSRSTVPKLARQGKRFHGDYLIKPGHYGMALCYDEDTGHFVTLEGNYAMNGPYRINIDPYRHGLNTWSSIQTISQVKEVKPKADDADRKDDGKSKTGETDAKPKEA